jgi:hypothetical protein
MKRKRIVLPLLSFWEACRLLFIILILSRFLPTELLAGRDSLAIVILLGIGNLFIPAGALYLFFTDKHSTSLLLVFCIAKITGIFTCLLALGTAAFVFFRGQNDPDTVRSLFMEGAGLLIIFFMDLIFLIRLLSLKVDEGRQTD